MIHLATQASPAPAGWRPPISPRAQSVVPRRRRGGRAWPFLSQPAPRTAAPADRPPPSHAGMPGVCSGDGN